MSESEADAFDASTWYVDRSDSDDGPPVPDRVVPTAEIVDLDTSEEQQAALDAAEALRALLRERVELRASRDGAVRKATKQQQFLDDAITERDRLAFRLDALEREIDLSTGRTAGTAADDADEEQAEVSDDGVVGE